MKTEDDLRSQDPTAEPQAQPYRPPRIIEWGSILDLTRGSLAGYQDATFGGSDPLFRRPPPPG